MLLFIVLPFSCKQNDDPLPEAPIDTSISIEEAKDWFETTFGTTQAANARTGKASTKKALWDFAKESKFKKGQPLVVVPLDYDNEYPINSVFEGNDQPGIPDDWERGHSLIRKLLVFKDKKSKNQAVVMYVVPTQAYKKANPKEVKGENFTGLLLFKEYDEEVLLEGWRLENGEIVETLGDSAAQTKKNGRIASTCYVVTYGYYDCNDGPTRVGDHTMRVDATTGCTFVQTGMDAYCTSGGSGGYFEGTLPAGSGGGAGGIDAGAVDNIYLGNYTYDVLGNHRSLFTNSEWNYLIEEPRIVDAVKNWINYAGSRARDEAFINQVIAEYTPFNRSLNQYEVNTLSNHNSSFFYGVNLIAFAGNVLKTFATTAALFPWSGDNNYECSACPANSFRHAFLMTLHCQTFGTTTAGKLGEDHERDPTSGIIDITNIEIIMDRFNNAKGIDIFNNTSTLITNSSWFIAIPAFTMSVSDYLETGKLNYVKDNTLTPTNR